MVGLLATLDEIAHDDRLLDRLRAVRDELGTLAHCDVQDVRLRPFWETIKEAANPSDLKAYFKGMFEKHRHTIDDVMQADDPRPALGVLFPMALMLKYGKLSMGVLTSEAELSGEKPRRRFRDMLLRPRWKTMLLSEYVLVLNPLHGLWDAYSPYRRHPRYLRPYVLPKPITVNMNLGTTLAMKVDQTVVTVTDGYGLDFPIAPKNVHRPSWYAQNCNFIITDRKFWVWLGIDQAYHMLTNIFLAWLLAVIL